jgi:hypothetical protein
MMADAKHPVLSRHFVEFESYKSAHMDRTILLQPSLAWKRK